MYRLNDDLFLNFEQGVSSRVLAEAGHCPHEGRVECTNVPVPSGVVEPPARLVPTCVGQQGVKVEVKTRRLIPHTSLGLVERRAELHPHHVTHEGQVVVE